MSRLRHPRLSQALRDLVDEEPARILAEMIREDPALAALVEGVSRPRSTTLQGVRGLLGGPKRMGQPRTGSASALLASPPLL
jgi:hypothetical protein